MRNSDDKFGIPEPIVSMYTANGSVNGINIPEKQPVVSKISNNINPSGIYNSSSIFLQQAALVAAMQQQQQMQQYIMKHIGALTELSHRNNNLPSPQQTNAINNKNCLNNMLAPFSPSNILQNILPFCPISSTQQHVLPSPFPKSTYIPPVLPHLDKRNNMNNTTTTKRKYIKHQNKNNATLIAVSSSQPSSMSKRKDMKYNNTSLPTMDTSSLAKRLKQIPNGSSDIKCMDNAVGCSVILSTTSCITNSIVSPRMDNSILITSSKAKASNSSDILEPKMEFKSNINGTQDLTIQNNAKLQDIQSKDVSVDVISCSAPSAYCKGVFHPIITTNNKAKKVMGHSTSSLPPLQAIANIPINVLAPGGTKLSTNVSAGPIFPNSTINQPHVSSAIHVHVNSGVVNQNTSDTSETLLNNNHTSLLNKNIDPFFLPLNLSSSQANKSDHLSSTTIKMIPTMCIPFNLNSSAISSDTEMAPATELISSFSITKPIPSSVIQPKMYPGHGNSIFPNVETNKFLNVIQNAPTAVVTCKHSNTSSEINFKFSPSNSRNLLPVESVSFTKLLCGEDSMTNQSKIPFLPFTELGKDLGSCNSYHPTTTSTEMTIEVLDLREDGSSNNNNMTIVDTTLGGIGKLMSDLAGSPPPALSKIINFSDPPVCQSPCNQSYKNIVPPDTPACQRLTILNNGVLASTDDTSFNLKQLSGLSTESSPLTFYPPTPVSTTARPPTMSKRAYNRANKIQKAALLNQQNQQIQQSTYFFNEKASATKLFQSPSYSSSSSIINLNNNALTPNLKPLTLLTANLSRSNSMAHHAANVAMIPTAVQSPLTFLNNGPAGTVTTPFQMPMTTTTNTPMATPPQYVLFTPGAAAAGGGGIGRNVGGTPQGNIVYGQQMGYTNAHYLQQHGNNLNMSGQVHPLNMFGYHANTNNALATFGQLAAAAGTGVGSIFFIAGNVNGQQPGGTFINIAQNNQNAGLAFNNASALPLLSPNMLYLNNNNSQYTQHLQHQLQQQNNSSSLLATNSPTSPITTDSIVPSVNYFNNDFNKSFTIEDTPTALTLTKVCEGIELEPAPTDLPKPSFITNHMELVVTVPDTDVPVYSKSSEQIYPSPGSDLNTTADVAHMEQVKPVFETKIFESIQDPNSTVALEDIGDVLIHFVDGHVIKESSFPLPLKPPIRETLIHRAKYLGSKVSNELTEQNKDLQATLPSILPQNHHIEAENVQRITSKNEPNSTKANTKPKLTYLDISFNTLKPYNLSTSRAKQLTSQRQFAFDSNNSLQNGELNPRTPTNGSKFFSSSAFVTSSPIEDANPKTAGIMDWTVEDVYKFVLNLVGCSEYADTFRSNEIDGPALYLLKEEHLTSSLRMKLGPALKLQARVAQLIKETSRT